MLVMLLLLVLCKATTSHNLMKNTAGWPVSFALVKLLQSGVLVMLCSKWSTFV